MTRDANDIAQELGPAGVRDAFDCRPIARQTVERGPETPTGRQQRFELRPFQEIGLSARSRYLVDGVLPLPGLTIIWGPPKVGKSFWVFDLLMHVALDCPYRGRRVTQGPVVYVLLEGVTGFEARKAAFEHEFLKGVAGPIPFYLISARLDLAKDYGDLIDCIREKLGGVAPAAVAFDTVNRSLSGSENDDKDMQAYVKGADTIRAAFDCAVLLVHHSGIDHRRPRGHTSLSAAADAQISVRKGKNGEIVVTVEWLKDGVGGDVLRSQLQTVDVGEDENGDPITSCVLRHVDDRQEDGHAARRAGRGSSKAGQNNQAQRGLKILQELSKDGGGKPVELSTWRTACMASDTFAEGIPDSRRRTFDRVRDELKNTGFIEVCGNDVALLDNS